MEHFDPETLSVVNTEQQLLLKKLNEEQVTFRHQFASSVQTGSCLTD